MSGRLLALVKLKPGTAWFDVWRPLCAFANERGLALRTSFEIDPATQAAVSTIEVRQ